MGRLRLHRVRGGAGTGGLLSPPLSDPRELGLAQAWATVRGRLPPTPLVHEPALSRCLGRPVHLKLESLQVTGSFKLRGALVALSRLLPEERGAGVVACSSGNHGKAVAWAARDAGISAVICVPGWVDPVKAAAMEAFGAQVRRVGESYDEAEAEAVRLSREEGRRLVHPFDEAAVVAGQGTVALEILNDCPGVEWVLAPLSGGGLAGGIAYGLRAAGSRAGVLAVTAEKARVMRASLEAGQPVELAEEPTLASALAGGIGLENALSFDLVREAVARHHEVTEEEIARAMAYGYEQLGLVLEGGGATALAALLARELPSGDGPVAVVLSGGNLDLAVLSQVLDRVRSSHGEG